ncbi:hypothetical protein FKP32DRAFT_500504 [Trametes sanguinea]|nr:hypothetical protein FKP32DRAFT_500504 [Trametes sanguinea]
MGSIARSNGPPSGCGHQLRPLVLDMIVRDCLTQLRLEVSRLSSPRRSTTIHIPAAISRNVATYNHVGTLQNKSTQPAKNNYIRTRCDYGLEPLTAWVHYKTMDLICGLLDQTRRENYSLLAITVPEEKTRPGVTTKDDSTPHTESQRRKPCRLQKPTQCVGIAKNAIWVVEHLKHRIRHAPGYTDATHRPTQCMCRGQSTTTGTHAREFARCMFQRWSGDGRRERHGLACHPANARSICTSTLGSPLLQ